MQAAPGGEVALAGPDGEGTAVDPLEQPPVPQPAQVPADRLERDAEPPRQLIGGDRADLADLGEDGLAALGRQHAIMGVYIDKIVRDDRAPIMKYEPNHPDANSEGYVAYPNINPVVEMADLIEATRAYQANVAAFQSAKTMAGNAILMMQA